MAGKGLGERYRQAPRQTTAQQERQIAKVRGITPVAGIEGVDTVPTIAETATPPKQTTTQRRKYYTIRRGDIPGTIDSNMRIAGARVRVKGLELTDTGIRYKVQTYDREGELVRDSKGNPITKWKYAPVTSAAYQDIRKNIADDGQLQEFGPVTTKRLAESVGISEADVPQAVAAGMRPKTKVEGHKEEVAKREAITAQRVAEKFEAGHLKLADGAYVPIKQWNELSERYQSIGIRQGYNAMAAAMEADQSIIKNLENKGYMTDKGLNVASYLVDNPKDVATLKAIGVTDKEIASARAAIDDARKVWLNVRTGEKITDEEHRALGSSIKVDEYVRDLSNPAVKEIMLDMIPIVGTIRYIGRASEGGWTGGEIYGASWRAALDIATLAIGFGAAGAGARAAVGAGRMARVAGAARGVGQFALAEIKAPYTMVRHPVQTAKAVYRPFATLLHPKAVPLAAVETSYSTLRVPVRSAGGDAAAVREIREAVTDAAIHGKTAKATVRGTTVRLEPTVLKQVGAPVAVHTTPDVRPFMTGTIVKGGREGGLYLAPDVHTRFSYASGFGDLPEGGVKGALLIRDRKSVV